MCSPREGLDVTGPRAQWSTGPGDWFLGATFHSLPLGPCLVPVPSSSPQESIPNLPHSAHALTCLVFDRSVIPDPHERVNIVNVAKERMCSGASERSEWNERKERVSPWAGRVVVYTLLTPSPRACSRSLHSLPTYPLPALSTHVRSFPSLHSPTSPTSPCLGDIPTGTGWWGEC